MASLDALRERIEAVYLKTKDFTDKVIAHHDHDRENYDLRVTFAEARYYVEEVIDIYTAADVELQKACSTSLKPQPRPLRSRDASWEAILKIPWIGPGS